MAEMNSSLALAFEKSRQNLAKIVSCEASEDRDRVDLLVDAFLKEPGSSGDKKTVLDQVFKDGILQLILQNDDSGAVEKLLSLSIEAFHKDICNATLPVILLGDIFDCLTIEKCEELFAFVEKHVDTWKQEAFFNSTKNSLLRMCNDLLRRLSRSQNTVFCGRILLFLAKFFPLSERSGLNVASEFNYDNVTVFGAPDDLSVASSFPNEKGDPMEEGEMPDNSNTLRVDYNLYRKFWALQDFFRNPNQCYNKIAWRSFIAHSDEVLKAFSCFKLDDVKPAVVQPISTGEAASTEQHVYFAKYLTNPKLLDLQLSDSNFRRCVLIQFLILFQYLQCVVKFKPETHVLTDEQNLAIKAANEKIYKLLEETPPNGTKFAQSIEHILKREEHWNHWKNEGCPDFYKPSSVEVSEKAAKPTRPKRKAGDDIRVAVSHNKCLLGNASLTKLWNLCPDNMEACRSQKRDFLPSLETFFEEAIEQADPANMIEDEYKRVYNGNYGWRALRLLARRSPHFFTPSTQPISKLPLYLETMIKKLAKELPHAPEEEIKADLQDKAMVAEGADDSDDELLKNAEDSMKEDNGIAGGRGGGGGEEDIDVNQVTTDQINAIVDVLGSEWKTIAPLIGCEEDEIAYYESEYKDPVEQGRKMLTVWRDNFGENATVVKLVAALNSTGFDQLAKDVFKDED